MIVDGVPLRVLRVLAAWDPRVHRPIRTIAERADASVAGTYDALWRLRDAGLVDDRTCDGCSRDFGPVLTAEGIEAAEIVAA